MRPLSMLEAPPTGGFGGSFLWLCISSGLPVASEDGSNKSGNTEFVNVASTLVYPEMDRTNEPVQKADVHCFLLSLFTEAACLLMQRFS